MIITEASHYATINSTAFVAQVVPVNVDKPILTIVRHAEGESIPTNMQSLINLMHTDPRSDLTASFMWEGAEEMQSTILDNVENQAL